MMAFHELIKTFDLLRDYMRDFFVFGYKTRSDYEKKSTRTYDNERRRIESYLGDYIRWEYGKNGKKVFLSVDSSKIPHNPFYQAYRSKIFTDNDITLHFFIADILENSEPQSVEQITDEISLRYGEVFDSQTVRGKLKEYTNAGILIAEKRGKELFYSKSTCYMATLLPTTDDTKDFLAFFSEIAPFSVIGSFLGNRLDLKNERILFKHHFLAHTLEDTILISITEAIHNQQEIELENLSTKTKVHSVLVGIPIVILVSVQTGRRYLIFYSGRRHRFLSLRLDYIKSVKLLNQHADSTSICKKGEAAITSSWGSALSWRQKTEHFAMTLSIDENREQFIIGRLEREGRGGLVERIGDNQFRFSVNVTDTNELMNWVKSFIGRIISIEGDNKEIIERFYSDIRRIVIMYGGEV